MNQSDTIAAKFPWAVPGAHAIILRGDVGIYPATVKRVSATRLTTEDGQQWYAPKYGLGDLVPAGDSGYSYRTLVSADDPRVAKQERRADLLKSTRTARNAALKFQRSDSGELETVRAIKALEDHLEEIRKFQNGN